MSTSSTIAVVGTGDLAEALAAALRRSADHRLAGRVGPGDPLPEGAGLVISVAAPEQRVAVIEQATAAGLPVVTLPLTEPSERARRAIETGRVASLSPLAGLAATARLQREVAAGALGRRYGLFTAQRVRQSTPDVFTTVGLPLLRYVVDVLGEVPPRVQVTRAALFGAAPDAWFALLRCVDGSVATVEFGATLPASSPAPEEILVEATGSDAVLRAEPARQAVTISGRHGTHAGVWWADPAAGFVTAAVDAAHSPDAARESAWLRLVEAVRTSAETGEPVAVG